MGAGVVDLGALRTQEFEHNGRPVRDKLILGAVRAAYSDYLPRDRHPVVALFVTLDTTEVDANVHPAKTEVRFRNAGLVRALIVHALKDGLAREGKRGHIIAKMNALNEASVIRALYDASQAGVKIELIVRGACSLRPGLPGISDTVSVRSVVGRFLEHSRVYWFGNGGKPEIFCSSADWMERNLLRRVETCFPILDPALAERVFNEELANYLADNQQAWQLHVDGGYSRIKPQDNAMPYSAQGALLAKLCG